MNTAPWANPHKYRRGPGGRKVVDRVEPYIILKMSGYPDHVLFQGKVWYDNGDPIEGKIPEWVQHGINRLTPEGKKKVGF